MPQFSELIFMYLLIISIIAVIMTVIDKTAAKKRKHRISETALMIVGLLGGALPMYITMKTIRHKTKHKKFMIGLPVEIVLHVLVLVWLIIG